MKKHDVVARKIASNGYVLRCSMCNMTTRPLYDENDVRKATESKSCPGAPNLAPRPVRDLYGALIGLFKALKS